MTETIIKKYSMLRDADGNDILRVKYEPAENQHYIGELVDGVTVASVIEDPNTKSVTVDNRSAGQIHLDRTSTLEAKFDAILTVCEDETITTLDELKQAIASAISD